MRLYTSLLLVPVATALLYACGGTDTEHPPEDGAEDVILEGDVSDETFIALKSALDQGTPADEPTKAATLDEPLDGAKMLKSPAPAFKWHFGGATGRIDGAQRGRFAGLELSPLSRADRGSPIAPLRELLGPLRSASAHGEPFNGTATYLVFSVDTEPKLVRVLTGGTTYTPSEEEWSNMVNAGKPITLTLMSAAFEQDRVKQGGGPFKGSSVTFTVAP
jgi:hypothetical protein